MNAMNMWHIIGGVALVALMAFGYYAISPLFRNVKVDEALPEAKQMEDRAITEQPQSQIVSAPVVGTTGHPASGTARIIDADGKKYIRYENFKTINGPDIYVYIAKDLDAKEFVNLGPVKATEGNINYEIPAGVNVAEYTYVLTWCKAFGVLFNYADVSMAQ